MLLLLWQTRRFQQNQSTGPLKVGAVQFRSFFSFKLSTLVPKVHDEQNIKTLSERRDRSRGCVIVCHLSLQRRKTSHAGHPPPHSYHHTGLGNALWAVRQKDPPFQFLKSWLLVARKADVEAMETSGRRSREPQTAPVTSGPQPAWRATALGGPQVSPGAPAATGFPRACHPPHLLRVDASGHGPGGHDVVHDALA